MERVFRDLRDTVDIRPVYHRLADRIRAHVLLCWLALLGEVWQTNPVTAEAKRVFDTLGVKPPRRYYALPTPGPNRV